MTAAITYMQAVNQLERDPSAPYESIYYLVSEYEWKKRVAHLQDLRDRGVAPVGNVGFSISGIGDPRPEEDETLLDVYACTDATHTQFIDLNTGSPTLMTDVEPVLDWRFTMILSDEIWYVSDATNSPGTACPE